MSSFKKIKHDENIVRPKRTQIVFTVNHFFSHIFINIKHFSFYNCVFPWCSTIGKKYTERYKIKYYFLVLFHYKKLCWH